MVYMGVDTNDWVNRFKRFLNTNKCEPAFLYCLSNYGSSIKTRDITRYVATMAKSGRHPADLINAAFSWGTASKSLENVGHGYGTTVDFWANLSTDWTNIAIEFINTGGSGAKIGYKSIW